MTSTIVNRTQPKFSKYDGKCDHLAVNQFIHQFNSYFPLVKPTNPHDKVHVAASHLTGEVVTWWQHWSSLHTYQTSGFVAFRWDIFVHELKTRFLPPQYLTNLADEFYRLKQNGSPVLKFSGKVITLAQ